MKRLLYYTGLICFLAFSLTGCYRDVIIPTAAADPDGPAKAVSYKTDLAPIFNTGCAKAGCHVSGSRKPFLATDISYAQIIAGGFVNTSIPKSSILYQQVFGGMKEYIPSASDRQKVYDWIRLGAQNN